MKKKIFISLLAIILCFTLIGCEKNERTKDDTKLNDAYNKVNEYFNDENADRSNLSAYYLDTENNVVVVVLIDDSKEKQESFIKLSKIDSKYLKFVQGGPYFPTSSKN